MILLETDRENKTNNDDLKQHLPQAIIYDKAFLKIFAPFHFIQKILGSCRVDVRNGVVSAPTLLQKGYTIISGAVVVFYAYKFIISYTKRYYENLLINGLYVLGLGGMNLSLFAITLYVRFHNNEGNIQLFIRMQQIDNVLQLKSNDRIRVHHYKQNLMVAAVLVFMSIAELLLVLFLTKGKFGMFELLGATWNLNIFAFELVCCSSLLTFFTKRVRFINSIIIAHLENGIEGTIENISKRCIVGRFKANIAGRDFESSETDVCIQEIFRGFTCFQNQYRFQLCFFCIGCSSWLTGSFLYAILVLQSTVPMNILILDIALLCFVPYIYIGMLVWLCIRSEKFSQEVKKTKKLSIFILSRHVEGPLRQKVKRMLKIIEDTPPRFSVYNMWCINGRLLLNVFHIITTSWVIVLQITIM